MRGGTRYSGQISGKPKNTSNIVPLKTRTGAALERRKKQIAVARIKAAINANPELMTAPYGGSASVVNEALTGIANILAQGQPSGAASVHVFDGHNIRVVEIDGAPWFVAVDVCRALDMSVDNGVSNHLRRLKEDEKKVLTLTNWKGNREVLFGTHRGRPALAAIAEPGLYKLVMRSSKDAAEAWQNWLAEVVLPAIRKDGGYVLGEEKATRLDPVTGQPEMTIEELEVKLAAMKAAKVSRLEAELAEMRRAFEIEHALRVGAEDAAMAANDRLNRIPEVLRNVTARDLCEEHIEGNATMREIFTCSGSPTRSVEKTGRILVRT